ncbi:uncharacterized protein PHALS_03591 [Plasmopara halstedii]|uniref:Uncharacterized protein n=1 Tax=Plasmopara halstedii TaxID=4781 RepID=A0A0P1AZM9_PLAHL|nr:uncharacterized protein PHALS_03591 [Plasmopara halstedii]CEG46921.1 hypothetical protein PHALS_03591 [Plasmopara halstedii]|eukprot:XP_024583290.1 hypothetical protein PHALS_03591 [Plasmopara halstedii]
MKQELSARSRNNNSVDEYFSKKLESHSQDINDTKYGFMYPSLGGGGRGTG